MKKAIISILAILAVFALVMTGCPTPAATKTGGGNSEAKLTSLKIDGKAVTLGQAISDTVWDDLKNDGKDLNDLTTAQIATFTITESKTEATFAPLASASATVEIATTYYNLPSTFKKMSTVDLEGESFIVIRVTSGDKETVNFYVVAIVELDNNTTLSSISIAGGPPASAVQGSSAEKLDDIYAFCEVSVSNSKNTNAEITLVFGASFHGTAKIAKVAKGGTPAETDFEDYSASPTKPTKTFADEDQLYVKMTAMNGETVRYYAYKVLVGWDATLKDIVFINEYTVGTQTVTEEFSVDTLGTPQKDTFANFPATEVAKIQFSITQPASGFKVNVVKNDPDQTITVSKDGTTPVSPTDKIIFTEGDFLYVKVISQNTKATNWYKVSIALKRSVNIPYGSITGTLDADNPGAAWDDPTKATEWLLINRSNATEGTGWLDQPIADRSHGRAKLMWDEDGLWIYAEVWEKVVSTGTGEHEVSSVELFINENYPGNTGYPGTTTGDVTGTSQQNGGQYRLGANGERSGAPSTPAISAFNALGRFSAKKFTNIDPPEGSINNLKTGYKVLFQAPWLYPSLYPLADNRKIAIELQINATGEDGTRVGVLNWNNISSNSYSSLTDYGEAILKLNGNTLKAMKPNITAQPQGKKIALNEAAIPSASVTAASLDNGTLSFKWYVATDTTSVGTEITTGVTSTATSSTVALTTSQIPTTAVKDFYIYCTVTNTSGTSTNTANSVRALYRVFDPNAITYTTQFVKEGRTGWDAGKKALVTTTPDGYGNLFYLPFSKNLAEYSRLEIKYTVTGGTIPTNPNNADLFIDVQDSTGADVTYTGPGAYEGHNYNVNGFMPGGCYIDISDAGGAYWDAEGGTIILKFKPDGGNASKEIIITSVLLLSNDALDLTLSNATSTGWPSSGFGTPATGGFADGKITWDFDSATDNQNRGFITFTAAEIGILTDAEVEAVYFRITGTSTSPDDEYRAYIGKLAGADWNSTNMGNVKFSAISGNAFDFGAFANPERAEGFILRGYATTTVEITKIEIFPAIYE